MAVTGARRNFQTQYQDIDLLTLAIVVGRIKPAPVWPRV